MRDLVADEVMARAVEGFGAVSHVPRSAGDDGHRGRIRKQTGDKMKILIIAAVVVFLVLYLWRRKTRCPNCDGKGSHYYHEECEFCAGIGRISDAVRAAIERSGNEELKARLR